MGGYEKNAQVPVRIEQLGRVRVDDYQWMKDDNWQAVLRDPSLIKADVKEHLTAENAYRESVMASTLPLQAAMFSAFSFSAGALLPVIIVFIAFQKYIVEGIATDGIKG